MKMVVTSLFGVFYEAPGDSARSYEGVQARRVVEAAILSGLGPLRTDVIIRRISLKNDASPTENQRIAFFDALSPFPLRGG